MAQLGSLDVTVYPLEAGSILVSTQKGWEGKEVSNTGGVFSLVVLSGGFVAVVFV